jgi:hypothetical protein
MKNTYYRNYVEFWFIIFFVSIGFAESLTIGFYRSRMIDLLLILSSLYLIKAFFYNKPKIKKSYIFVLLLNIVYLIIRLNITSESAGFNISNLKTSFGMSAIYLTPAIYLLVRESHINGKTIKNVIKIALIICLLSQLGLLTLGESSVSGAVNLGNIFGIPSRAIPQDYPERTITIWRAIGIGYLFAILLLKNNLTTKIAGLVLFILFYGGGGGSRSGIIFIIIVPIIMLWWSNQGRKLIFMKKLIPIGTLCILFGLLYLNAPAAGEYGLETKDDRDHKERVSEVFNIFSKNSMDTSNKNLFSGRIYVMSSYMFQILANPRILLFGTGFSFGNAFDVYDIHGNMVNEGLAHNVFIDTWGLSGLFGLTFLIIYFVWIIRDMKKLIKTSTNLNYEEKKYAYIFSIAVLYFMQYLMVQAVAADRSFMIVFFFTAGLLKPVTSYISSKSKNKMNKRLIFS